MMSSDSFMRKVNIFYKVSWTNFFRFKENYNYIIKKSLFLIKKKKKLNIWVWSSIKKDDQSNEQMITK